MVLEFCKGVFGEGDCGFGMADLVVCKFDAADYSGECLCEDESYDDQYNEKESDEYEQCLSERTGFFDILEFLVNGFRCDVIVHWDL